MNIDDFCGPTRKLDPSARVRSRAEGGGPQGVYGRYTRYKPWYDWFSFGRCRYVSRNKPYREAQRAFFVKR
jgi:hypothetical protein